MEKNIFIFTILLLVSLTCVCSVASLTRPPSVPCSFEGEVISYKSTTSPENGIGSVGLTVKIDVIRKPVPEFCSYLSDSTVSGTWYLPGQSYYLSDEPGVDIDKVLTKGAVIEGNMDSFDKIITNLTLVREKNKGSSNELYFAIIVTVVLVSMVILIKLLKYKKT